MARHGSAAGRRIRQIQLSPGASNQLHPLGAGSHQGLAQLASGTGEEHLHGLTSPAKRNVIGKTSNTCTIA
jgi:hypothetical protein